MLGGARRSGAHRGRRGAEAYCGGRPPTACYTGTAGAGDVETKATTHNQDVMGSTLGNLTIM